MPALTRSPVNPTILPWSQPLTPPGVSSCRSAFANGSTWWAGAELEMETNGDSLQLRKVDSTPALVRKKGILVHRGDARSALDIVAFMRSVRDSRSRRIAREGAE